MRGTVFQLGEIKVCTLEALGVRRPTARFLNPSAMFEGIEIAARHIWLVRQ